MTAVERRDLGDTEPLGDGDDSRAGSVVLVVGIGGRNQRTGVANDHSGTPEAVSEQILVIAAEVGTAAGERPEPGRRPLPRRHRPALPTSLGKHGRNPVVRQLLDQPPQLVPLRTHIRSVTPRRRQDRRRANLAATFDPAAHRSCWRSLLLPDAAACPEAFGHALQSLIRRTALDASRCEKINAHSHDEHVTVENIAAFVLLRRVELRGLEPLTL